MSRTYQLAEAVRALDPDATVTPDGRGGAVYAYHVAGTAYRLTLSAGAIVRNYDASGTRAPFPPGLTLPVWAFRGRDAGAGA